MSFSRLVERLSFFLNVPAQRNISLRRRQQPQRFERHGALESLERRLLLTRDVTIFSTDFESGIPAEISGTGFIHSSEGYDTGNFLQNTSPTASSTAELTLTGLPEHTSVSLDFLLAIINSWDGIDGGADPDFFNVTVDGISVFSETFDNFVPASQTYDPPAGVLLTPRIGPTAPFSPDGFANLGFDTRIGQQEFWGDALYAMGNDPAFTMIPHTSSTLTVRWFASGAGYQGGTNESWAIDDLRVTLGGVNTAPEIAHFSTDFESGIPQEITGPGVIRNSEGYDIGNFLQNTTVSETSVTKLTLTNLPNHTSVSLDFLLAIINSWDGVDGGAAPDFFNVTVDGISVFSEAFDNFVLASQTYDPPDGVLLTPRIGPTAPFSPDGFTNLGLDTGIGQEQFWGDALYAMGNDPAFRMIPHTSSTLTVRWFASGAGYQGGTNESWAIDDLRVTLGGLDQSASAPRTVNVIENRTAVVDIHSSDPDGETENGGGLTYSLTGNADDSLFIIDPDTGVLSFREAPNFENPRDIGRNNAYSVQVTVTDRGLLTSVQNLSVVVADGNDSPVVSMFGTTAVPFTENGVSVGLSSTAVLSDADSPIFDRGVLTVSVADNADAQDILSVRSTGSGNGQIGVSGANVLYGGTAIGTLRGGTGSPLVITLNSSATIPAVQALIRSLTFKSISDSPSSTKTISVQITDGKGGVSNPVTRQIAITRINDVPLLTATSKTVSYSEGALPTIIEASATVFDVDSSDLNSGRLTISIVGNVQSTDRIGIRNTGNAANQVGVSGNTISFGGTAIGTFSGTTSLTITFNVNATPAAAQAVLRNVTFSSISDNPSVLERTLKVTLTDGDGGASVPAMRTVRVVRVNDAPTVRLLETPVTYTEGGSPALISGNAAVQDPDSENFSGGRLTISIVSNLQSTDRVGIRNTGNAVNQIGVSGNTVSFGGTAIGTFSGTTSLMVTFNVNATPAAVQAVLRNVTFSSVSDNPSVLERTLKVTLTDGDGGTSLPATKTVRVVRVNDAPTVRLFETPVTYTEGGAPVLLSGNASVQDPDSDNFSGGRLTISVVGNMQSTDRVGIRNTGTAASQIGVSGNTVSFGGTAIGTFSGTTSLIVTFNVNATVAAVQAVLRNVTFSSISDNPSVLERTLKVTLTDGDGGTSIPAMKTVRVASRPGTLRVLDQAFARHATGADLFESTT